jgi:ElaB/YqjD/DUF883 family membrane-anchored ribosome-binding protein
MNAANTPVAVVDDIRKDLQALREEMGRLAGQLSAFVSATGDHSNGDLKQRMRQMGDAAAEISERSRDAANDMIDRVGATLEANMRTRPFATLVVAVGLGFIVGALWRR